MMGRILRPALAAPAAPVGDGDAGRHSAIPAAAGRGQRIPEELPSALLITPSDPDAAEDRHEAIGESLAIAKR